MTRITLRGATALATGLFGGIFAASPAFGQAADQAAEESKTREVVVVTATRREEDVQDIPLTIAAIGQDQIDELGIKNAADLVRVIPGLNTVANAGGAQQTFSVRGIVAATGAATTSVYLDETNLTKRNNGGVAQNNGVTIPLLYDLERVEVLKGPQGTLFGGSSQGGTIRFITPRPDLDEFSAKLRTEASTMGDRSEESYEFAGSVGGPIVQDALGFRVSGIYRENGGWVDVYSGYTNQLIAENANSSEAYAARGVLLWEVNDGLDVQLSTYYVHNESEGGPASTTAIYLPGGGLAPAGTTFTTPAINICSLNRTRTLSTQNFAQPNGPAAASVSPVGNRPPPSPQPNCSAAQLLAGGVNYTRPSFTYGPWTTGEDISIATGRQTIVGTEAEEWVSAFTVNADLGFAELTSITSYLQDIGRSDNPGGEEWASPVTGQWTNLSVAGCVSSVPTVVAVPTTCRGFPLFMPSNSYPVPGNTQTFKAKNAREGWEQEIRLTSNTDGPLEWVAGAYFSRASTHILYFGEANVNVTDQMLRDYYGPTWFTRPTPASTVYTPVASSSLVRYGLPLDQGFQARLEAFITEKELAGYADVNYWLVPDEFKLILGLRVSQVELDYFQTNHGQFSGRLPSSLGANTIGSGENTPITPKYGVQWHIDNDNMMYATYSKGFRAGGVNPQLSAVVCDAPLTQFFGITSNEVPADFAPDTVWNTEIGGKFSLFGDTLTLNLAGYNIDWQDIQATISAGTCPQSFVVNGGSARSQGVDLQAIYRPIDPLTLTLAAGYTDAYYVDPVRGPIGPALATPPQPAFNPGDQFDVPPFQVSASAQYEQSLGAFGEGFVRLDWNYQNEYTSGATFGTTGWSANYFARYNPERQIFNLRAGLRMENGADINFFVNNLLDNDEQTGGFSDGRGSCTASSLTCASFGTFNPFVAQTFLTPRVFGVQMNYRY
ncbi:MAG: TonB-dependent receptor [Hyphomonadaceae bacterium]|nr:TonB-dependent receptor [Hyphomonadaceae bacterium]